MHTILHVHALTQLSVSQTSTVCHVNQLN